MRVLVTGGLGYLGGQVCEYLTKSLGLNIRIITTRPPRLWPRWATEHDVQRFDLKIVSSDKLRGVLEDVNTVVHLAALNAAKCVENPTSAIDVNIKGTEALTSAAISAGVGTFVYLSTAHIYGAPLVGDLDETVLPRPKHPYAWTHRAAEDVVLSTQGMRSVVFRLSNVIGSPRDHLADCWNLVGCDLCRQAVFENRLILSGAATESRDFICMSDVVKAISSAVLSELNFSADRLFNLGSGKSITIQNLAVHVAEISEKLFGRRPAIKTLQNKPTFEVKRLKYVVDKLSKAGFSPSGTPQEALAETLNFFQTIKNTGELN